MSPLGLAPLPAIARGCTATDRTNCLHHRHGSKIPNERISLTPSIIPTLSRYPLQKLRVIQRARFAILQTRRRNAHPCFEFVLTGAGLRWFPLLSSKRVGLHLSPAVPTGLHPAIRCPASQYSLCNTPEIFDAAGDRLPHDGAIHIRIIVSRSVSHAAPRTPNRQVIIGHRGHIPAPHLSQSRS